MFIKRIIRKIFINFLHYLDVEFQLSGMNDIHSKLTSLNAKFYKETDIFNSQNDKTKIIVGDNTHIRGALLIFPFGGAITIGNDCYIGDHSRIWSAEKITIGNNVLISHNVNICDTNAHELCSEERVKNSINTLKNGLNPEKGSVITGEIIINDNVWINFNAIILKGITIGKGAIIAAGAVVTKDVAPYTLVAGNPARFVKKVN